MFLPESMSRIVIVGSNSCIDETIDVLYDLEAIHLIDQTADADEGFTLGTPRPYSPKTAERLLKVRGMEKDLGINKHTKTQPISESEIKEDFMRFIRHEAMRANCSQEEIIHIINRKIT